ncbi:hypothetical protein O3P69_010397 [Scylla paramamosain]|uniref:C3H1-type domain-containing protein n=1 Tax=Scylla paramamosain TaxID=85552 RepID=A0AAW0TTP0_SCYPA
MWDSQHEEKDPVIVNTREDTSSQSKGKENLAQKNRADSDTHNKEGEHVAEKSNINFDAQSKEGEPIAEEDRVYYDTQSKEGEHVAEKSRANSDTQNTEEKPVAEESRVHSNIQSKEVEHVAEKVGDGDSVRNEEESVSRSTSDSDCKFSSSCEVIDIVTNLESKRRKRVMDLLGRLDLDYSTILKPTQDPKEQDVLLPYIIESSGADQSGQRKLKRSKASDKEVSGHVEGKSGIAGPERIKRRKTTSFYVSEHNKGKPITAEPQKQEKELESHENINEDVSKNIQGKSNIAGQRKLWRLQANDKDVPKHIQTPKPQPGAKKRGRKSKAEKARLLLEQMVQCCNMLQSSSSHSHRHIAQLLSMEIKKAKEGEVTPTPSEASHGHGVSAKPGETADPRVDDSQVDSPIQEDFESQVLEIEATFLVKASARGQEIKGVSLPPPTLQYSGAEAKVSGRAEESSTSEGLSETFENSSELLPPILRPQCAQFKPYSSFSSRIFSDDSLSPDTHDTTSKLVSSVSRSIPSDPNHTQSEPVHPHLHYTPSVCIQSESHPSVKNIHTALPCMMPNLMQGLSYTADSHTEPQHSSPSHSTQQETSPSIIPHSTESELNACPPNNTGTKLHISTSQDNPPEDHSSVLDHTQADPHNLFPHNLDPVIQFAHHPRKRTQKSSQKSTCNYNLRSKLHNKGNVSETVTPTEFSNMTTLLKKHCKSEPRVYLRKVECDTSIVVIKNAESQKLSAPTARDMSLPVSIPVSMLALPSGQKNVVQVLEKVVDSQEGKCVKGKLQEGSSKSACMKNDSEEGMHVSNIHRSTNDDSAVSVVGAESSLGDAENSVKETDCEESQGGIVEVSFFDETCHESSEKELSVMQEGTDVEHSQREIAEESLLGETCGERSQNTETSEISQEETDVESLGGTFDGNVSEETSGKNSHKTEGSEMSQDRNDAKNSQGGNFSDEMCVEKCQEVETSEMSQEGTDGEASANSQGESDTEGHQKVVQRVENRQEVSCAEECQALAVSASDSQGGTSGEQYETVVESDVNSEGGPEIEECQMVVNAANNQEGTGGKGSQLVVSECDTAAAGLYEYDAICSQTGEDSISTEFVHHLPNEAQLLENLERRLENTGRDWGVQSNFEAQNVILKDTTMGKTSPAQASSEEQVELRQCSHDTHTDETSLTEEGKDGEAAGNGDPIDSDGEDVLSLYTDYSLLDTDVSGEEDTPEADDFKIFKDTEEDHTEEYSSVSKSEGMAGDVKDSMLAEPSEHSQSGDGLEVGAGSDEALSPTDSDVESLQSKSSVIDRIVENEAKCSLEEEMLESGILNSFPSGDKGGQSNEAEGPAEVFRDGQEVITASPLSSPPEVLQSDSTSRECTDPIDASNNAGSPHCFKPSQSEWNFIPLQENKPGETGFRGQEEVCDKTTSDKSPFTSCKSNERAQPPTATQALVVPPPSLYRNRTFLVPRPKLPGNLGICFLFINRGFCERQDCHYSHEITLECESYLGLLILHFVTNNRQHDAWTLLKHHLSHHHNSLPLAVSFLLPLARYLVNLTHNKQPSWIRVPSSLTLPLDIAKMRILCVGRHGATAFRLLSSCYTRASPEGLKILLNIFVRFCESFPGRELLSPWEKVVLWGYDCHEGSSTDKLKDLLSIEWLRLQMLSGNASKVLKVYNHLSQALTSPNVFFTRITCQVISYFIDTGKLQDSFKVLGQVRRLRAKSCSILTALIPTNRESVQALVAELQELGELVCELCVPLAASSWSLLLSHMMDIHDLPMTMNLLLVQMNFMTPEINILKWVLKEGITKGPAILQPLCSFVCQLPEKVLRPLENSLSCLINACTPSSQHMKSQIIQHCKRFGINLRPHFDDSAILIEEHIEPYQCNSSFIQKENSSSITNNNSIGIHSNSDSTISDYLSSNSSSSCSQGELQNHTPPPGFVVFHQEMSTSETSGLVENIVADRGCAQDLRGDYVPTLCGQSELPMSPSPRSLSHSVRSELVSSQQDERRLSHQRPITSCQVHQVFEKDINSEKFSGRPGRLFNMQQKHWFLLEKDGQLDHMRSSSTLGSSPSSSGFSDPYVCSSPPSRPSSRISLRNEYVELDDERNDSGPSMLLLHEIAALENVLEKRERVAELAAALTDCSNIYSSGTKFSSIMKTCKTSRSGVPSPEMREVMGALGILVMMECVQQKIFSEAELTILTLHHQRLSFFNSLVSREKGCSEQQLAVKALWVLYHMKNYSLFIDILEETSWSGGVEDVRARLQLLCEVLDVMRQSGKSKVSLWYTGKILASLVIYYHSDTMMLHNYHDLLDLPGHLEAAWECVEALGIVGVVEQFIVILKTALRLGLPFSQHFTYHLMNRGIGVGSMEMVMAPDRSYGKPPLPLTVQRECASQKLNGKPRQGKAPRRGSKRRGAFQGTYKGGRLHGHPRGRQAALDRQQN